MGWKSSVLVNAVRLPWEEELNKELIHAGSVEDKGL